MLKKFAQLGLLMALVFGTVSQAQAGLLVEPVLGYNLATKLDIQDGGEKYSGGRGMGWGGRLGYQNLGFQLGLDYLNSSIDMDDRDLKGDVKMTEWAAFVGFEFPVLLRVYAGYIFAANGEGKNAFGQDVDLKSGSGTKFGVGFTTLPWIDINIEYRSGTFDEMKVGSLKGPEVNYSSVLLSLSLPLVF